MTEEHFGEETSIVPEVRTRRLTVVDDAGFERAIIEVNRGHVELRLISNLATPRCEVLIYAGQQDSGMPSAGVELWADGNSIGGSSLVSDHGQVQFATFAD